MAHDLCFDKAVLDLTALTAGLEQAVAATYREVDLLQDTMQREELQMAQLQHIVPQAVVVYDSARVRAAARLAADLATAVNSHAAVLFDLYYLLEAAKRPCVVIKDKLTTSPDDATQEG